MKQRRVQHPQVGDGRCVGFHWSGGSRLPSDTRVGGVRLPEPYRGALRGKLPEEVDGPHDEDRRAWFSQVPGIVFELGLNAAEIALYTYYKQKAGAQHNGRIKEGSKRLGARLGLSDNTIVRARRRLVERGLIRVDPSTYHGSRCFEVTVLDIWDDNRQLREYRKLHRRWPGDDGAMQDADQRRDDVG